MPLNAALHIEGPEEFRLQIEQYLQQGKRISPHTRRLIESATLSPVAIHIQPLSDDPATWHRNGDRSRSHTRAIRQKRRSDSQKTLDKVVIFINQARISATHKTYSQGTLIHELVHAYDLAAGQYHEDYVLREKRAVFFQNMWRKAHGKRLRKHYHHKFDTLEYSQAVDNQRVTDFVDYYFSHDDLPSS